MRYHFLTQQLFNYLQRAFEIQFFSVEKHHFPRYMNFDEMKDAFLCGWFFLSENENDTFNQQLTQVLEFASRNCSSLLNMARKLTVYESVTRCVGCGSWEKFYRGYHLDPNSEGCQVSLYILIRKGRWGMWNFEANKQTKKQRNKTYLKHEQ